MHETAKIRDAENPLTYLKRSLLKLMAFVHGMYFLSTIQTTLGNNKQLLSTELQCSVEKDASKKTFGFTVLQAEVDRYVSSSEQREYAVP